MELIPIILIVLEVVAGLTILTLIISYFSFKIKQKNALLNKKEESTKFVPDINRKPLQNKEIKETVRNPVPLQNTHPGKNEKDYKSRNVQSKPYRKEKTVEPKSRIEVLKQLSQDPTNFEGINKEEKKISTSENLKSLNDDVFEKYSDNDQHKMYTLHVKNNKDNSKEKE